MKQLAADIRYIRKRKGISVYKASKDTGISVPTLTNIEKGVKDYRMGKLLTYLDYLGLKIKLEL